MAGSGQAHLRARETTLLRVEDLHVEFKTAGGRRLHAVSGVSLDVREGETLGIVGESGCGKSTTARAVLQLPAPTRGHIWFDGVDLTTLTGDALRAVRRQLQIIFQDPASSINPRRRARDVVYEGLRIWQLPRSQADEVMRAVGLDPALIGDRRAHQLSGGQCQRVCIARAVAPEPRLLVCDEPVSALDVSVQAQILNLLEEMKARYSLSLIFIAHDLAVVKNISDRVMVMYLGKTCEVAPPDLLYERPAHPYTAMLLGSAPRLGQERPKSTVAARGDLPSPLDPPSGCRFRTRCPRATAICTSDEPSMREVGPDQFVACHHPMNLAAAQS
jgi:peptide/nickel transport system ATP-binding protein